jgi:hypothetical protein
MLGKHFTVGEEGDFVLEVTDSSRSEGNCILLYMYRK